MILVLSGTRDGREIIDCLLAAGYQVTASVVSNYGAELLSDTGAEVLAGRFKQEELEGIITGKKIKLVVDATHPYADKVSEMALHVCYKTKVPYLRYQRPFTDITANPLIHRVKDYETAAQKASLLGDTIFLTTGSKTLEVFSKEACKSGKRLIARVLPDENVVSHCLNCGLQPSDIIAMQGPFSNKLNQAMLEQVGADVIVTKESGHIGGADTKIEAALEMKIPVVLIERPLVQGSYYSTIVDLIDKVKEILQ